MMNRKQLKKIRNDAIGDMNLGELEKEAISRTLKHYNNNRRVAAKSLGISERTLYRKIDLHNMGRKIRRVKPYIEEVSDAVAKEEDK